MSTMIPARRILLVEEDEDLQTLLETLLQSEGYHTEAVSTVEAALHKLDAQLYDLILTGLQTTTPPRHGDTAHLQQVLRLRQACHPVPVGLLTTWPIDLAAAERTGLAFAVHMPHDLDRILRRIADCLNAPFTPEQHQQAQRLRHFLEAVGQGNEGLLRVLCSPTVGYYPLTRSLFTQERAILGIDAYVAYVHLVHQRLPDSRIEHIAIFAHRNRLIARYLWSWQGADGQRQLLTGSIQCRFWGELIVQIGEALPTERLRALLEPPQAPPG